MAISTNNNFFLLHAQWYLTCLNLGELRTIKKDLKIIIKIATWDDDDDETSFFFFI